MYTQSLSLSERCDIVKKRLNEGTLTRHQWRGNKNGRELVCLLLAMFPEIDTKSGIEIAACPANMIPEWFAHLVPWIDDAGSLDKWHDMILRFVRMMRRTSVLSPETWARLDYAVRAIAVREAMKHTSDDDILKVCEEVAQMCEQTFSGEIYSDKEWALVRERTNKYYWSDSAVPTAACASTAATAACASTAPTAAAGAVSAAAAAGAYIKGARAVAADRMIDNILSTIEDSCSKAEQEVYSK